MFSLDKFKFFTTKYPAKNDTKTFNTATAKDMLKPSISPPARAGAKIVVLTFTSAANNPTTSKIPIIIEPNGYQAILSGKGKIKPSLDFLPKSYNLNEGLIVYTSGKDGILLAGIPIGKININERSIDVNLIIDPGQLSFVNVIFNKSLEKNN